MMLEYLYREPKAKSSEKGFILLHGYGANAQDLFPLEQLLDINGNYHFFSFQAPNKLQENIFYDSRAWFPIDESRFIEAQARGQGMNLEDIFDAEIEKSIDLIQTSILSLSQKYNFTSLVLGGFSQGAMCAMHVAFNQIFPVEKLLLFSPGFLGKAQLEKKLDQANLNFNIFQSHGKIDPILSFEQSKKLNNFFIQKAFTTEFVEFDGGHEIPQYVIDRSIKFLTNP